MESQRAILEMIIHNDYTTKYTQVTE